MPALTIGLDIAKNVFQIHGVDRHGKTVVQRKLRRAEVLKFFAKLECSLVGIEACHGSHFWARELTALGHTVRLLPTQYVKPFLVGGKNDANDAAAICAAVTRSGIHFVAIKSAEQQSMQSVHRMRCATAFLSMYRLHTTSMAAKARSSIDVSNASFAGETVRPKRKATSVSSVARLSTRKLRVLPEGRTRDWTRHPVAGAFD
ncbi:hypothetical protein OKW46_000353 [Paraburkholderia sp. WSM4179]|nr:hypothetical protein [Paraburkholderia sp. WSM4179]